MMEKSPQKRISVEQLKADAFFAGVDWEAVAQKKLRPPINMAEYQLEDEVGSFAAKPRGEVGEFFAVLSRRVKILVGGGEEEQGRVRG